MLVSNKNLAITLILGFLLRIVLASFEQFTLSLDFNTFVSWSDRLYEFGFAQFYNQWSDYLPGYLYLLYVLSLLKDTFHIAGAGVLLLYKLPAILADIATAWLIYKLAQKNKLKSPLLLASFYLFNPAIIANSAAWGQVDGFIPLFVLLCVYFAKNVVFSAIILAAGTLVKPQVAFVVPIFVYLIAKTKGIYLLLLFCLVGLSSFVIGFLPFAQENLFEFVATRLNQSANQYPYLSVNAFNFWGMVGGLWESDLGLQSLGFFLLAAAVLYSLYLLRRNTSNIYLALALILYFAFLVLTRIHERHMLPVFASLLLVNKQYALIIYALLSVTYLANITYSYLWVSSNFYEIFSPAVVFLISVINVLAGIGLVFLQKLEKFKLTLKSALLLILLFVFLGRLVGIIFPPRFYFDEVYHAFSAKEIVLGNPHAWEYWADPPEGFAYEWTHPPLAKLGMAGSMSIFGINSFAWRLPQVIVGTFSVLLLYKLVQRLFNSKKVAFFSVLIFSFDGLPLVMSRIGMNDTYFIFFMLAVLLGFLKNRYFLSALFLGLAASAKWTALFIIPLLGVVWLLYKRDFKLQYLWFILLPPLCYLASYTIFFTSGHTLLQWWETQQQMWWYHSKLVATHPFSSYWWSWPFMLKPVWLYVDKIGQDVVNIYIAGNPLVFWGGTTSIIVSIIFLFKMSVTAKSRLKSGPGEINAKAVFLILVCYFGVFLPWALSPRIMFLYHYLPAIPFMAVLVGHFLSVLYNSKYRIAVFVYLFLVGLTFILYFPLYTGVPAPEGLSKFLL